jgi:hypothetical protein
MDPATPLETRRRKTGPAAAETPAVARGAAVASLAAIELDRRGTAGRLVRLLWVPEVEEILVEQREVPSGKVTLRQADSARALEVFNHPEVFPAAHPAYAYTVAAGEIELEGSVGPSSGDDPEPPGDGASGNP